MTPKVQIVNALQVPELLERLIAIRYPDAARSRTKSRKNARARAKNWDPKPRARTITIRSDMGIVEAITAAMQAQGGVDPGPKPTPLPRGANVISPARSKAPTVTDLNRCLNPKKVDRYLASMIRGEWVLTPDAIAITPEGLVINGQHRLAAAFRFAEKIIPALAEHPGSVPRHNPQFIVAWGIDKRAAHLMDEARRSPEDRRTISMRAASLEN